MSRFNEWYDYLLPWNYGLQIFDNIHTDGYQFGDILGGFFAQDTTQGGREEQAASQVVDDQEILGYVANDAREEFEEDRAHTEAREDSAYQRGVEDMRKAGLNPYTIGASPAASSSSNVGYNDIASKVQLLGYLLDLKNLDFKNKELVNKTITSILKVGASAAMAGVGG